MSEPSRRPRRLVSSLLLVLLATLVGCATPASVEGMTLDPDTAATLRLRNRAPFPVQVVSVTGGEDARAFDSAWVEDEGLHRALEASLTAAGFPLGGPPEAYALEAAIESLRHPTGAFDMPAFFKVRYRMTAPASEQLVFDHTIEAGYLVPFRATFSGAERLRLAVEGAARDNIAKLVEDLVLFGSEVDSD